MDAGTALDPVTRQPLLSTRVAGGSGRPPLPKGVAPIISFPQAIALASIALQLEEDEGRAGPVPSAQCAPRKLEHTGPCPGHARVGKDGANVRTLPRFATNPLQLTASFSGSGRSPEVSVLAVFVYETEIDIPGLRSFSCCNAFGEREDGMAGTEPAAEDDEGEGEDASVSLSFSFESLRSPSAAFSFSSKSATFTDSASAISPRSLASSSSPSSLIE